MDTTTLYFGKINYNSEIHKVHSKEILLSDINKKILSYFENGITVKEVILSKKDEKEYTKEFIYEFFGIETFENRIILGNVAKSDFIYKKTIDKESEQIKKERIDSEESILFYYDVYKEIVAFHTTNKFKYAKFIKSFEMLLNESFRRAKDSDRFTVSLKNNISSLEEVFQEIAALGIIKEIRIDIIPPNPSDDLIMNLEEESKKQLLKEMSDANITRKSTLFSTKSSEGLKIDKNIIKNSIKEMNEIHKDLNEEDMIKKNYSEISAISESGEKFSTNENKPLKHIIPETKRNKHGFLELVGSIINSL